MFKNVDGMGVLTLSAHAIVTIIVILAYGYTAVIGHPDSTLQSLALISGGYWFGQVKGVTDFVKPSKNAPSQVPSQPVFRPQVNPAPAVEPQPAQVVQVTPNDKGATIE